VFAVQFCGLFSLKSYDLSFERSALGGIFRFRNTRQTLCVVK